MTDAFLVMSIVGGALGFTGTFVYWDKVGPIVKVMGRATGAQAFFRRKSKVDAIEDMCDWKRQSRKERHRDWMVQYVAALTDLTKADRKLVMSAGEREALRLHVDYLKRYGTYRLSGGLVTAGIKPSPPPGPAGWTPRPDVDDARLASNVLRGSTTTTKES